MRRHWTASAALLIGVLGGAPAVIAAGISASAPATTYNWSGFYLGGQVGYQWGESSGAQQHFIAAGTDDPLANHNDQGVAGGAHLGYNW